LYRWPSACLNAGWGYAQRAQYGKFAFVNLYTNAHLRGGSLVLVFAALAAVAFAAGVLAASPAVAKQPLATYVSISDGDVFSEPLPSIEMCFAEPVNTADLPIGGDFRFEVVSPTFSLGLRTVFQLDGNGLAVYPGQSPGDPNGDWVFNYRVTSRDTHEALEGTIKYRVDPSGQPVPKVSPPACLEGGATPEPGSGATAVPTRRPTTTPSSSAGPSGSGAVSPTASPPASIGDSGDSNPDILLLALLTVGAAGGAAVVALFGYVLRRRVGFWMHRPPPGGPDDGAGH
jgi:hypothetical protein